MRKKLTDQISDSDNSLPVCCHVIEQCLDAEVFDRHAPLVLTSGSHVMLTFWC